MKPTIGRIVIYQTDGRGGLSYQLPAIINCTRESHPDYGKETTNSWQGVESGEVDGSNPVPIPNDETTVHLTVFTPGAKEVYRELNVPYNDGVTGGQNEETVYKERSWHWPPRV